MSDLAIKARILIVEDDVKLNEQLTHLLQAQGFETSQALDGEQGLLMALSEQFDLILLDVSLPRKNGYAVLKVLRQSRTTPVIISGE